MMVMMGPSQWGAGQLLFISQIVDAHVGILCDRYGTLMELIHNNFFKLHDLVFYNIELVFVVARWFISIVS